MSTKTKSSSTSQQQGTATNTLDPNYLKLLNSNVDAVNQLGTSYKPYAGSDVADFTPAQLQAQNLFTGIANDHVGQGTLNDSTAAAKGVAGYQPVSVTAPSANAAAAGPAAQIDRSGIRDVNGGLLTGVDLSKYQNPYTQQVVDATSADLNNQRLMEQNQNASDATKAGAWRGNALAVTNAVSSGNWDRTLATTIANLRQAGYTQAAQNAEQDLSRGFAADQGNQGVDLSVAGTNTGNRQQTNLFNAGNQQQTNLANQATAEDAAKANQAAAATAAALRLQGSGQLAANSNQDLSQAATRAGLVAAVGDTQQAQQQKQLDWLYQNNYLNPQQYQLAIAQLRNQAVSLVPNQQTISTKQTGSGTGTSTTSGLGTIVGPLLSAGATAAKFFA